MSTTSPAPRAWAVPTMRAMTGLLSVLILVQASLAGQFLFDGGSIDLHGYIGNASFALGVMIAATAVLGRLPRPLLVLSVLVLAALFAQIGLGYSGRESLAAASYHIPVGVLCLGLTTALGAASIWGIDQPVASPTPPA